MTKTRTKTTNSRKKTRTKTGSRILLAAAAVLSLLALPVAAKNREKGRQETVSFAVIAGTAFRPPGFSLPGARVRLAPDKSETSGAKLRAFEAVTDARGEFAFRVPAVPARWSVRVESNGYQPQTRVVSVEGEQRFDLSFQLEPAAGDAKGDTR